MTGRGVRRLWVLLLAGGLLATAGPARAQQPAAPSPEVVVCDEELLGNATRFYDLGLFDEAIEALTPCLPGRLRPGVPHFARRRAIPALRIVALSYLAQREPENSRPWIEQLMKSDPSYRADPAEDPLLFQDLVDELRPPRWYQRRWVQAGGALVVGGAVSYFVFRPEPDVLPHPGDVFTPPGN